MVKVIGFVTLQQEYNATTENDEKGAVQQLIRTGEHTARILDENGWKHQIKQDNMWYDITDEDLKDVIEQTLRVKAS